MYEVHVPGWGNDSFIDQHADLEDAKVLVGEFRKDFAPVAGKIEVSRVFTFMLFGWYFRIEKCVWTEE